MCTSKNGEEIEIPQIKAELVQKSIPKEEPTQQNTETKKMSIQNVIIEHPDINELENNPIVINKQDAEELKQPTENVDYDNLANDLLAAEDDAIILTFPGTGKNYIRSKTNRVLYEVPPGYEDIPPDMLLEMLEDETCGDFSVQQEYTQQQEQDYFEDLEAPLEIPNDLKNKPIENTRKGKDIKLSSTPNVKEVKLPQNDVQKIPVSEDGDSNKYVIKDHPDFVIERRDPNEPIDEHDIKYRFSEDDFDPDFDGDFMDGVQVYHNPDFPQQNVQSHKGPNIVISTSNFSDIPDDLIMDQLGIEDDSQMFDEPDFYIPQVPQQTAIRQGPAKHIVIPTQDFEEPVEQKTPAKKRKVKLVRRKKSPAPC